jgi:hypothetical protein
MTPSVTTRDRTSSGSLSIGVRGDLASAFKIVVPLTIT